MVGADRDFVIGTCCKGMSSVVYKQQRRVNLSSALTQINLKFAEFRIRFCYGTGGICGVIWEIIKEHDALAVIAESDCHKHIRDVIPIFRVEINDVGSVLFRFIADGCRSFYFSVADNVDIALLNRSISGRIALGNLQAERHHFIELHMERFRHRIELIRQKVHIGRTIIGQIGFQRIADIQNVVTFGNRHFRPAVDTACIQRAGIVLNHAGIIVRRIFLICAFHAEFVGYAVKILIR